MKKQSYNDEPKIWKKIRLMIIAIVLLCGLALIGFLIVTILTKTVGIGDVPMAKAKTIEPVYCDLNDVYCEDEEIPVLQVKTPSISNSSHERGIYGVTAYAWTGNKMANGEYPHIGACASNDFPFGTKIELVDLGITCVVKDRGGMGSGVIDIYMGDRESCIKFGRKYSVIKTN